ncbi:hypothetical protein AgCh_026798 [Apium graveolens]
MRPKLIRNCYNQNCNMQQQQHLLPAGTGSGSIRSIYSFSSSSASIISTSITITPSPNKFKFNYTRPAAAASSSSSSSSSSSNSNKHQHQPNLLHFDDYYNNNNGTTTSTKSSSDTNALNFETTSNPLSLNNHDDASALASASASPRMITKRQTMNRSSILAKQVIAIHSANTLGFVSQLWLHTSSWLVSVVELRPNLLSGQAQPFLLQDIHQVGDVVLVQDESVTENEISMVGLETLVGYDVVTPGRKKIGKVRGYTFNVNTGAVVSLELDSFGISIIPSSLVSSWSSYPIMLRIYSIDSDVVCLSF